MTHQPKSKISQDIIPVIQRQLSPIINKALSIEIRRDSDMPQAVEVLSKLNNFNDKITAERERITKPLLEALAVERGRWKPMETSNKLGIEHIRTEMMNYKTTELNKQKIEEAKIAKKLQDGKINLEKAVKQIEKIKVGEKEYANDAGLVQFRETQVLKITDESKVPVEYKIIDEKHLLEDLKRGLVVPGAKIEITMTPVNYR